MQKILISFVLLLGLQGYGALRRVAQERPTVLISPRLAALEEQVQTGRSTALVRFWQEITTEGTPLIESIPGDPKHVLVTFIWQGGDEVRNVVVFSVLGVLINYTREQLAENQMTRVPGTDIWYKTYRVPKNARFTYYLSPNDPLLPSDERKGDKDWASWQSDPLNPHRHVRPHPGKDWISSLVELPDAPPQPWAKPTPGVPAGRVDVHRLTSNILNNERRIWVYTPPNYKPNGNPYSLLVLFDGWTFSQMIPTTTVLDNLLAEARIPPLVAVMVEHPTQEDRLLELACYPPFNEFLAKELVPWVRRHYHVTSNADQTVVGGQSRGGLAAAFVGLEHPEIFGNIISHSGYFSWDPREEEQQDGLAYEWLVRQYAAGPKLPLRFYLSVGVLEQRREFPDSPTFLQSNRHMRDVLVAKGYPLQYRGFGGGHEDINVPSTLAEGLLFLIGTNTEDGEAPGE